MRNCASGMQALDSAVANIRLGRSELVLAGGVDALSHAPLLFSEAMTRWLANWFATRNVGQKLRALKSLPLRHLAPVVGIMKGLTDPVIGQLMGQTAENLAFKFGITRAEMDAFAVHSHQRVVAAQDAGHYADEIVPLIDRDGKVYAADDGVRRDSSMANLCQAQTLLRQDIRPRHPRQQLTDHRWRGLAGAGFGRGGRAPRPAAARPASWTASGPALPPPRWASGRCMPRCPSCSAMAWHQTISMYGSSMRLLPPRSSPACALLMTMITAARTLAWRPTRCTRGVTAQRGWRRGGARSSGGRERRAHCSASARGVASQGWSGAAWRRSASAAGKAGRCWWRRCDEREHATRLEALALALRRYRPGLAGPGQGGRERERACPPKCWPNLPACSTPSTPRHRRRW